MQYRKEGKYEEKACGIGNGVSDGNVHLYDCFCGYWSLEDGRWEYRDDSGARVRNTLKKSGSHYWWLGPDGYLRTGHAGEKVLIGNAAFMLHNDGRIDRIGEDASGGKVDLFDLIGDKETPRRFDTWDFYETAKDGICL